MYTSISGGKLRLYSYGSHFILAIRLDNGTFLLNGDRYSNSTSKHQSHTRTHCNPNIILPFSALREAGIDGRDMEKLIVVDQTPDQTREVDYKDHKTGEMKTRTEHLLGACVFKHGRKYLLSGIDTDAKTWGGGYFLVELPRPVTSVLEAFESLKPKDLDPEDNYTRQGEFFFIPQAITTRELKKLQPRKGSFNKTNYPKGVLMKSKNIAMIVGGNDSGNPHIARDVFIVNKKEVYCRGSIRHPQHKMINLGNVWHKVLINQAKASFSSGGNVD